MAGRVEILILDLALYLDRVACSHPCNSNSILMYVIINYEFIKAEGKLTMFVLFCRFNCMFD